LVEKGFDPEYLNALPEAEFIWLLDTRVELEQARADAAKNSK